MKSHILQHFNGKRKKPLYSSISMNNLNAIANNLISNNLFKRFFIEKDQNSQNHKKITVTNATAELQIKFSYFVNP